MSIYTKKGDSGMTSLYGGTRISKSSLRVDCYGKIDTLNSYLGLVYSTAKNKTLKGIYRDIQKKLFNVGFILSADAVGKRKLKTFMEEKDINVLENYINEYTKKIPSFRGFTIPGASEESSWLHILRTETRGVERSLVELSSTEEVEPLILKYVNRLSDLFYVLAKFVLIDGFVNKVMESISDNSNEEMPEIKNSNIDKEIFSVTLKTQLMGIYREIAEKIGINVSLSIVNNKGNLIYFDSMENTIEPGIISSQKKAYTAWAMEMNTYELSKLCVPGGSLFGLETLDPRITLIGGGYPIFKKNKLMGGLGIGGGSAEEDMKIAKKLLEYI